MVLPITICPMGGRAGSDSKSIDSENGKSLVVLAETGAEARLHILDYSLTGWGGFLLGCGFRVLDGHHLLHGAGTFSGTHHHGDTGAFRGEYVLHHFIFPHHLLLIIEDQLVAIEITHALRDGASGWRSDIAPDIFKALGLIVPPEHAMSREGAQSALGVILLHQRQATGPGLNDGHAAALAAFGHH